MSLDEVRDLSQSFRITKRQRNQFDYLRRKAYADTVILPEPPRISWQCDQCGYLVCDAQMRRFSLDFGCPRCKYSFHQFRAVVL